MLDAGLKPVTSSLQVLYPTELTSCTANHHTRIFWCLNKCVCVFFDDVFFFLCLIWVLRAYVPFKNISLISSRSFIKGGRKPEYPGKNHLTIRKQNAAFPHVTRARLEPQRWEILVSVYIINILYAYVCAVLGPRGWQNMELSWIHGITESSEKSTEMSVVLDYSHPNGPKPCTWS